MQPQLINLTVNGKTFTDFRDFSQDMTDQFKILFSGYISSGRIQITQDFINESHKTFANFNSANLIPLSDKYFENFTFISNSMFANLQYGLAFHLWTAVLGFAKQWEDQEGKLLHKGSPYYFAGMAAILQNDFDAGLMSMHNGLLEDKRNNPNWSDAPGYYFMSLNDQKAVQAFKIFVDGMVKFIRGRLENDIESYIKTNSGNLTYNQLRSKFLDNTNVSEEVRFYFVYAIIRIWHLRRLHKAKIGDTIMAPLIYANAIFDLLLVIDELLKPWENPQDDKRMFADHYNKLSSKEGWNNLGDHNPNNRRDADFSAWCTQLIDGTYTTTSGASTVQLERNFVLAYGLRNFSAHSVKSYEVMWQNYTSILQAVLNCLFKTVELI